MSNAGNKIKGAVYERQVADYIRDSGVFPNAERAPRWGSLDKGDLTGTGNYLFELKQVERFDLAGFIKEAQVEAKNASKDYPVVVIKRRQKSTAESYVVMQLDDFLEVVRDALSD